MIATIIILSVLLILSLIANYFAFILVKKAMETKESFEDFFQEQQKILQATIARMTEIDARGSFQSDDEVGAIFEQLKGLVDALDVFVITDEEINAKKK